MRDKDIFEKHLLSFNDIFADIVNVLLLSEGRRRIQPGDLQDVPTRSFYQSSGEVHEQERDIAKIWTRRSIRFCLIGMENQTTEDENMPLRVFGYDAGDYRAQVARRDAEIKAARDDGDIERSRMLQHEKFYPVVTLVLHYGLKRWRSSKNLLKRLKVPRALMTFVNDYPIHVVDVAWLTEKQERAFTSDFRIVVNYFRQLRLNRSYVPSPQAIQHVDAVLKLMAALTGDRHFEEAQSRAENIKKKGTRISMRSFFAEAEDRAESRGIEKGRSEGRNEGIQEERESVVLRMLRAGKLALKEIAEYSGLTLNEVKAIQRGMA